MYSGAGSFFNFLFISENAINVAGKDKIVRLFNETEDIENSGGLMINVRHFLLLQLFMQ